MNYLWTNSIAFYRYVYNAATRMRHSVFHEAKMTSIILHCIYNIEGYESMETAKRINLKQTHADIYVGYTLMKRKVFINQPKQAMYIVGDTLKSYCRGSSD